jgi:hypothetical protein
MNYKIFIVVASLGAAAALAQDKTPGVPPTPTPLVAETPTPEFTPPLRRTPARRIRSTPDAKPTPTPPPSRTPGPGGDLDLEPRPTPTLTPVPQGR